MVTLLVGSVICAFAGLVLPPTFRIMAIREKGGFPAKRAA